MSNDRQSSLARAPHRTRILPLALAITLALSLLATAAAIEFIVTTTTDAIDAIPGNGICATADGSCSLRAAIQEANALPGADTVTVPAGTFLLTLAGANEDAAASGDLDITDDLTLSGAGAGTTILDGNAGDRVLHIDPAAAGVAVVVEGVGVRNGRVTLDNGGGILLEGTLTIRDGAVGGNEANDGGGGGIYAVSGSTLALEGVTIENNIASNGGGVNTEGDSTTTIVRSILRSNTASDNGGAIDNSGTLEIRDSEISGNTATRFNAGAIANGVAATLTIENSTISGNRAGDRGGATRNGGSLNLVNVTLTSNEAPEGGGIYNDNAPNGVTLLNTILAGNPGGDCAGEIGGITSLGHNLDGDGSCGLGAAGDIASVDPRLGPLGDNGGPTASHALLAGSPAIDAGDDAACPSSDQRGRPRPLDGDADGISHCDIGAFERTLADLTIALSASPDPAPSGAQLRYTLTATNTGPADATSVSVSTTLPSQVAIKTVAPGCSQGLGTVVTCRQDTLAAGSSTSFTIDAQAPNDDLVLTISAEVSALEPDPDPSNNAAAIQTVVGAPAALLVQPGPTPPAATVTARPGDAGVPVLQVTLSAQNFPEEVRLEALTLTAAGSGHDAADIAAVKLYLDANSSGVVDPGDTLLASARFAGDDDVAVLTLSAARTLAPGNQESYLVTFDFASPLANLLTPLAALLPALLLGFGRAPRHRRRRMATLFAALLLTGLFGSCARAPTGTESRSYQSTLTAITARGAISGQAVTSTGLPLAGSTVTVTPPTP